MKQRPSNSLLNSQVSFFDSVGYLMLIVLAFFAGYAFAIISLAEKVGS